MAGRRHSCAVVLVERTEIGSCGCISRGLVAVGAVNPWMPKPRLAGGGAGGKPNSADDCLGSKAFLFLPQ